MQSPFDTLQTEKAECALSPFRTKEKTSGKGATAMNIQKRLENNVLTIALEGRLDAVNAPHLSAVVENELAGIKTLVLDLSSLEYISSAGLRVILTAQDIMDEQGEMKVTHVNETVMEIFDITGLVDLLTIE